MPLNAIMRQLFDHGPGQCCRGRETPFCPECGCMISDNPYMGDSQESLAAMLEQAQQRCDEAQQQLREAIRVADAEEQTRRQILEALQHARRHGITNGIAGETSVT